MCIDEQMISFTGRCPTRQYVPRKPNSTGLKTFVLAGASGIVLDFVIYQGPKTFQNLFLDGKPVTGQGNGTMLCLAESLVEGYKLFCDRFFTSLPVILHLKEKGITVTGTINKKFIPQPVKFSGDNEMKTRGRGSCEQFVSSDDVALEKWYDNKSILMASSMFGVAQEDTCHRWSKKGKEHIEAKRPAVIREYNASMGGVNLRDRMISYHKINASTRKWPVRTIMHFIDLCLSSCWLEYRKDQPYSKMQLYDFRIAVALSLIHCVSDSESGSDEDVQDERVGIVPIPARHV